MKTVLGVVAGLCVATAAYADHHPNHAQGQAQGQGQTMAQGNTMNQGKGTQMQTGTPAAGMPDMSKMGPWTRKPTDEKKIRTELTELMKKDEADMMKGDLQASMTRIDFPIYMMTDDSKGMTYAKEYTREQYMAMMQPFYTNQPKDMKITHKPTWTIMSDSMVSYVDEFTHTHGKMKMSGKSTGMLIKKDGQWKWKTMAEAGWGDSMSPGTGGSGKTEKTDKTVDGGTK